MLFRSNDTATTEIYTLSLHDALPISSVLAAIGITSLVLGPWLAYRSAYVPAVLAALNLLPVGWLTRRVAPLLALGLAANRGDREALRMIEAHDGAWQKIRQGNQSPAR